MPPSRCRPSSPDRGVAARLHAPLVGAAVDRERGEQPPLGIDTDGIAHANVLVLLALRRGLSISSELEDYRVQDGALRHVGELRSCEADDRSAAGVLVGLADAVSAAGADRSRFVETALGELDHRLGGGVMALAVSRALESHPA